MVVLDKQTAPKELINSPHYDCYSSAAFPTILFFSICPFFFTLFLSLCQSVCLNITYFSVALSPYFSSLTLFQCLSALPTFPKLDMIFSPYLSSRLRPSLSQLLVLFFLSFFPHCFSSPIPLVWPTISGMPLTQHDKCLFFFSFFPLKKEQGEGIKENIELTTAGIIYTSAAALFIKPTIPGEKVPRKTQI